MSNKELIQEIQSEISFLKKERNSSFTSHAEKAQYSIAISMLYKSLYKIFHNNSYL